MNILEAAAKYAMFRPGDRVLAAVSGGPDSVAMLHALHTQSQQLGITLHIAHINHCLRGKESDADEAFVRELARDLGVDCTVERIDVREAMRRMRLGEEEAAREVRHAFLQRAATVIGANRIAVGHTSDDRAETVLLNIIRGAGIKGLAAMRPVNGNIVRPLIEASRADVEAYLHEHELVFRTDASNLDTAYARNRVRHELLPLLERDYNANVREALLRLAEIAADQDDFVRETAESARYHSAFSSGLDAALLLDFPSALLAELIRLEIHRLKGDLKDVGFEQVQRIITALGSGEDFAITLPSGRIYAVRKGSELRFTSKKQLRRVEFDVEINIPGATDIPKAGIVLEAEIISVPSDLKTPSDAALIDLDSIAGHLRARNARPGDRIMPLGMRAGKKLQDVFVDAKISRSERARAVVVIDDEKIVWVVGVVFSEQAKIRPRTGRVVRLAARRADDTGNT